MYSRFRPDSVLGRFITGAILVSHVGLVHPSSGWTQIPERLNQRSQRTFQDLPDTFKEDWVPPAPVFTQRDIAINKAAPVSMTVLELPTGRDLTSDEIKQAKVFDTPLWNTGGAEPQENVRNELGKLLVQHAAARGMNDSQGAGRLKTFVEKHPGSGYGTSLLIEAGESEWRHGYFVQSLATFQTAWDGAKRLERTDDRRLAEIALGRLLERRSLLGQKMELKALIEEAQSRALGGYAADALVRAKEVMWFLNHKAERNVFCGFTAANAVCVPFGEKPIFPDVHDENEKEVFIRDGLSAFELKAHSHESDGTLRVVKRVSGTEIPVPSVVHWNFSHYSAITEIADGLYRVTDDHLRFDSWVSKEALEQQMTGYFLVPQKVANPAGYVEVSDEEAKSIFGRHCVHARDPEGCQRKDGGDGGTCPLAMATYSFSMMNPGLFISDTPIQHRPAYGSPVMFQVNYDQRSVVIPDLQTFGNLGPRWSHSFAEAVSLTGTGTPNTQVKWIQGSGSYFQYNYNTSTSTYAQPYKDRPQLVYLTAPQGGPGYQLNFPDGSKKLFKKPNATTPTKYLISQIIDPLGNSLTFNYDSLLRLTSIVDALGQATTLSYATEAGDNVTGDTLKIRKITDPFSRFAKFKYTTAGQLEKIIDPVGITSQFRYAAGDFIDRMVTPYGPTEFTQGDLAGVNSETGRFLEAKDAQGYRERVEANDLALPESYQAVPAAPSSVTVNGSSVSFQPKNDNLFYRNTFYWDRQQMYWHPNDYEKCRIYNWLTSTADTITSVLGSIKEPLEGRVWFNYPGQTSSHAVGNIGAPSKTVRAVESPTGTTTWMMSQASYNDFGLITGAVDSEGREMKYEYYPNNRDLQYVKVKNGGSWETLLTISQYQTVSSISTGLPEILISASGLQTQFTYNPKGQVSQVTYSKGGNSETTRYIYDSNLDGTADAYGYLIRVEHTSPVNPALFVTLQSMTYDAARRIRTVTDAEGYTLTYDYDNLDRVTLITHPDSTTAQTVYTDGARQTHDVWASKDRAGRWTRMRYSQHRQLLMELDPLMRLTQYAWCLCGQIRELTDPDGKVTTWKRDAQGRVTEKILPDGEKYQYAFQPLSGRLATSSYPKQVSSNQTTMSFEYFLGGRLKKIDHADPAMSDVTYGANDYLNRTTSITDSIGTTVSSYISNAGSLSGAGALLSTNGSLAHDTLRYSYDWLDRRVKSELVNDDGLTVTRSEELTLDSLGRRSQIINNLGTFAATFSSTNLTPVPDTLTLPGGFSTEYTRYAANAGANALRLQSIRHKQGASVIHRHDYTYDLGGNLTAWNQTDAAASVVTSWTLRHDQADQLSDLEEAVNSVPQKKDSWHYDGSGNIVSTTTIPTGQPGTLSMRSISERNQLSQIGGTGKTVVEGTVNEAGTVQVNGEPAIVTKLGPSGPWRYQREVDFAAGTNTVTVAAKDGNNNTTTNNYSVNVSATADETLEYDDNGNLVSVRDDTSTVLRQYEWDARNRLLSVQSPQALVNGTKRSEFSYDGAGRRVGHTEKEYNGSAWVIQNAWNYIWDNFELAQKRDTGTGTVLTNYFRSGEQHGNDVLVYQPDHLGSPSRWYRVSDGNQGGASFSAFGVRTVTSSGPGVIERGYTGHLHHAASGLQLTFYRAYDPQQGRWLSEDPIEEAGGINLYAYVGNSPGMATDPLGLEVDGTYEISSGNLTITDRDGKGSASLSGCSTGTNKVADSGTGFKGPVPPGNYRIYKSPRQIMGQDTYILDPIDGNEGNDKYDGQYNDRYGFRMHLEDLTDKAGLKGSRGCIVMPQASLDKVKDLLNNTNPGKKKKITSPDDKNPGKTESFGRLPSLGTLQITP